MNSEGKNDIKSSSYQTKLNSPNGPIECLVCDAGSNPTSDHVGGLRFNLSFGTNRGNYHRFNSTGRCGCTVNPSHVGEDCDPVSDRWRGGGYEF
jgi:hypothetical protein